MKLASLRDNQCEGNQCGTEGTKTVVGDEVPGDS